VDGQEADGRKWTTRANWLLAREKSEPFTLRESTFASGNLTGRFCLGVVSPGCFPLKGKAQNDGSVQLEVAMDAAFKMNGSITGTVTCADESTGRVLAGTFRVREAFGTFTFSSCGAPAA
jgi:hypothetical protein